LNVPALLVGSPSATMNRPILSQTAPAFLPLEASARQKVHNRDAIATASRNARQSGIFLFAILASPLSFR
jgi:hypothetical protein